VFIGHFSLALASKRVAPRPSLGWLFAACQFPDLLWPVLVLAGVERVRIVPGDTAFTPLAFDYYPWSHSLLMDVGWEAALGVETRLRLGLWNSVADDRDRDGDVRRGRLDLPAYLPARAA
jgi:hypothetical protein